MTLLALRSLTVKLGDRRAVDRVNLKVREGELVGLIGPNGAGKTTLLRAVVGVLPSEGEVRLVGRSAAALSPRQRSRVVSFLPQLGEVRWPLSVEALVSLGRAPYRPPAAALSDDDRTAIRSAMTRMDVAGFRHRPASELSAGERARVLIARLLAQDTPLVLADEPTAGLDPGHQISAMEIFAGLAREGRGVLASVHDLGLAARWCDRLVMIREGCVIADDVPEEVLTSERLAEVYGVTAFMSRDADGLLVLPVAQAAR